jgi:hypothetical protein
MMAIDGFADSHLAFPPQCKFLKLHGQINAPAEAQQVF